MIFSKNFEFKNQNSKFKIQKNLESFNDLDEYYHVGVPG